MIDIYIFSYWKHRKELFYMLPSVCKNVDYRHLYIVWDDIFPDDLQPDYTGPMDWNIYQQQLGHEFTVINQSTLYDWHEDDISSGWYRQQYAKMLLPTYASTQYNIICDSDCFFQKPYTVFEKDKPILYLDDTHKCTCYYGFMEKYLKQSVEILGTYVGSCSLWDTTIVQQIWDDCLKHNNKDLIQCVREHKANNPDILCFSEFETNGLFAQDSHIIKPKNFEYSTNKNVLENIIDTTELLIFSAGMKDYLEWVNEKNSNLR